MWGDEFFYQVEDATLAIDDFIRSVNEWWAQYGAIWSRLNDLTGDANFPVPPFANWTWRNLVGENPRANETELITLARYWADEAGRSGDIASEAAQASQNINLVWRGDGAPLLFQQEMMHLQQVATGLMMTQADLAIGVNEFVINVVSAKSAFRAQVIMLLFELISAVIMAIPTLGGSLGYASIRAATMTVTIRTIMRKFLTLLSNVTFKTSLQALKRGAGRVASTPARLTSMRWPGFVPMGRGMLTPVAAGFRAVPTVLRGTGRVVPNYLTRTVAHREARRSLRQATREAYQRLRSLKRELKHAVRTGAPRATIDRLERQVAQQTQRVNTLRSPAMRRQLTGDLTNLLRGNPLARLPSTPTAGSQLARTDVLRSRAMARQAIDNGLTTWGSIRGAIVGYGGKSALIYGGGGWALQETFTHLRLNSMGVEGHQTQLSTLASAVVGAGLGGAPLALASRTPAMAVMGGIGGAAGYYGSTLTEVALNPNLSWSDVQEGMNPIGLLRAGGAPDLMTAITQGAVGGVWERYVGEYADWRGEVLPAWRGVFGGSDTGFTPAPVFGTMDLGNVVQPPVTPTTVQLPPAAGTPAMSAPAAPAAGGTGNPGTATSGTPGGAQGGAQPNRGATPGPEAESTSANEPPVPQPTQAAPPVAPETAPPAPTAPEPAATPTPTPTEPEPTATPTTPEPTATATTPDPPAPERTATPPTATPPTATAPDPPGSPTTPDPTATTTTPDPTATTPDPTATVADPSPAPADQPSVSEQPPSLAGAGAEAGIDPAPQSIAEDSGATIPETSDDGRQPEQSTGAADSSSEADVDEAGFDRRVREAVVAVTQEAIQHPNDPAHWKRVEGGWLLQGQHGSLSLVVLVDDAGAVQDAWLGSFTPTTTTSAEISSSLLQHMLSRSEVADADIGVVTMTLPHGSTVDVMWAVDPGLPEGQTYVESGSFALTAAGWQQTAPATIVVSGTVRADAAEALRDLSSQAARALARVEEGLPGPVGEQAVLPTSGRVATLDNLGGGMRRGDVWQVPPAPASAAVRPGDSGPPSAPDAGDRLASALADLRSGDGPNGPDRPVTALTGDPELGPKLAHFDDGTTVAFVIEASSELAPGATEVTPATWVFDGQQLRQVAPARVVVSDRLPAAPAAAQQQMAAMVDSGLSELQRTLPDPGRPHQIHNLSDLERLAGVFEAADAGDADHAPVEVVQDPLAGYGNGADPGTRLVVGLPGDGEFAGRAQSLVDALAREGYQVTEVANGWASLGRPGLTVRAIPPGGHPLAQARPMELLLLTPGALAAYQEVAQLARQEQLSEPEVLRRLAGHPDTAAPDGADTVRAPSEPTAPVPDTGAAAQVGDPARLESWTREAYRRFRGDDRDIADMARALADVPRADGSRGFSVAEIAQVKRHLFRSQQAPVTPEGGIRTRSSEPARIAEAWIRLREGRPLSPDLALLEHALAESSYLRERGPDATYEAARAHANQHAGWEHEAPALVGEDLNRSWPVRLTPPSAAMFVDASAADLAALGVGEGSLADLGYPDGEGLLPEQRQRYEAMLPRTATLSPYEIGFTQRSVSPSAGNRTVEQLAEAMRTGGWRGGPLHGVRWGDGSVVSLDNRRLWAARQAGLETVPLVVHDPNERLADWPMEWDSARPERNALSVEIRQLDDGTLVVGGDLGEVRYPPGSVPETFGEVALFRAADQRGLPGRLYGTGVEAVVIGEPSSLAPPTATAAETATAPAPETATAPAPETATAPAPEAATAPARSAGSESVEIRVDGYRPDDTIVIQTEAVDEVARDLLDPPAADDGTGTGLLVGLGVVPGLEGARPVPPAPGREPDGLWELSYHGTVVQVRIAGDPALPPGRAVVSPGRIEISGQVAGSRAGRTVTAALLGRALTAYGELVARGAAPDVLADSPATPASEPDSRDQHDLTRSLDPAAPQQSGARIRPVDYARAMEWAAEAYHRFRADDADVDDIANNLADVPRGDGRVGFTRAEILQIKNHLMRDEHLLDDYDGGLRRARFDADESIAEAWIRLREGHWLPQDLALLRHELAESTYLRENPQATYREAHLAANQAANWEADVPARTGEDLDRMWGGEVSDGDTAGLPEGPGGQSGGRVRLWLRGGDGAEAGGAEADPAGPTVGRPGGPELREGAPQDPAVPPQPGSLAGTGQLLGVGQPGTPPDAITTEQLGGAPGHGGPVAPDANRDAVVAAAQDLAEHHSDIPGDGYTLRFSDPAHPELLFVDNESGRPAMAFRFRSGPVAEGTVAYTRLTGDTVDGVPVYEITISDSIPVADRTTVARRVVVHEVAEILDAQRPRSFADRLLRRSPFDHHEAGILAELRLELADRAAAAGSTHAASDQRIGQIVDRLGRPRLDQVVDRLKSAGIATTDLDLVRDLAESQHPWRGQVDQQLRAAARDAIREAGDALVRAGVVRPGQVEVVPDTGQVRLRQAGETAYVPGLVNELASSGAVGERLRAAAVAAVADRLGGEAGLAPVRALARLHDQLPGELRAEYLRALDAHLAGLSSAQLAALEGEPLPPGLVAREVLRDTLTALTGTGRDALAARVRWRDDGGFTLAYRVGAQHVSATAVQQLTGWLTGRIAGGTTIGQVQAELAGILGETLRPLPRARQPQVAGALTAMGRLRAADGTPLATRSAIEATARNLLGSYELQPKDIRSLPRSARDLVSDARAQGIEDTFGPLRFRQLQQSAAELGHQVAALASEITSGAVPDTAARTRARQLATAAQRFAGALDQAASQLGQRSEAGLRDGVAAEDRANHLRAEAGQESTATDRFAHHRREAATLKAEQAQATAERHARAAVRYAEAQSQAGEAHEAYQLLALELTELANAAPVDLAVRAAQLTTYAGEAQGVNQRFQEAARATQPLTAAMPAGVPTGRLPMLEALATKINTMLAAQGVRGVRVRPDELERILKPAWNWATGEDGVVIPLGLGRVEALIKFRYGDAVQLLDPSIRAAEVTGSQLPQFPKTSRMLGATAHHLLGINHNVPIGSILGAAGAAIPGTGPVATALREGLQRAVLDVGFGRSWRWSVTGVGMPKFAVPGQVANNRGESVIYNVDGQFEVQVRTTAKEIPWNTTPAERVDTPAAADSVRLELALPDTLTEPAADNPARIDPAQASDRFPPHAVTGMSNLDGVFETALDLLGKHRNAARQQVHTMVQQELPNRLHDAINKESGFIRPIYDGGHAVALVQIRTEVVREAVEDGDTLPWAALIGRPSNQYHLEMLRVAFSGHYGGTEFGGSRRHSATAGANAATHQEAAAGGANAGVAATAGPESSWREGINAGGTNVRPNVQRYTGHTQAYQLRLRHTVTVVELTGNRAPNRAAVEGTANVLMPESHAYRYGLPVAPEAVRSDPDGNRVLRDTPAAGSPPGRIADPQQWPADYWLGRNGIPGTGQPFVLEVSGADQAQAQLRAWLTEQGWLPAERRHGWPRFSRNPMVRGAQVGNFLEVDELAGRLEGAYNQAAQQGVRLHLVRQRFNHAPQQLTLRVRLRQDWTRATLVGVTTGLTHVGLDITSNSLAHTAGEARTWSGAIGPSASTGEQYGGYVPGADAAGANAAGTGRHARSSGIDYGSVNNHVKLIEAQASGQTAVIRVPHTIEVVEVDTAGNERPVTVTVNGQRQELRVDGATELGIPADLLPEAPATTPGPTPAAPGSPAPATTGEALRHATILHLDGRGVWDGVRAVLPTASRPNSTAFDSLASFTEVDNLIASSWWLYGELGTDLAVDPRGAAAESVPGVRAASPLRSSLSIRSTPGSSRFVTAANLIVADGVLNMTSSTVRFGREHAFGADGGGSANAGVAGEAGTSSAWPRGRSRASTRIAGVERLMIENSPHYVYEMPVDVRLEGTEHRPRASGGDATEETTVRDRTVVYVLAERVALRLYAEGKHPVPPHQVQDALQRWADGKLQLDRKIVVGMLERYRQELIDAGLPVQHYLPNQVLRTPGLGRRIADRLAQLFPDPEVTVPARIRGASRRVAAYVQQAANLPEVYEPDGPSRLPEFYQNSLGQGGIEPGATLVGPDGQPVADLSATVLDQIREVVPAVAGMADASQRTPGIAQGWRGQLAGNGWTGQVETMLRHGRDPDTGELTGGLVFEVPVRYGHWHERVLVRMTAELSDGRRIGFSQTTQSVAQAYAFAQHDFTGHSGWSHGLDGEGGGTGVPLTASGGIDRGYTGSASSSTQHTELQGAGTFDGMHRYQRDLTVRIEVTRLPAPDRDAAQAFIDGTRDTIPTRSAVTVTGQVVQLVPTNTPVTGAAAASGTSGAPAATADPVLPDNAQVAPMPDRYYPESVHAPGLLPAVRDRLAQPDLLGPNGVAVHGVVLEREFAAQPLAVGLKRMLGPGGYPALSLPVPGDPSTMVQVMVHADRVQDPSAPDLRGLAAGRSEVQLRYDDRAQHVTGHNATRTRLFPLTRGLSGEAAALGGFEGGIVGGEGSSQSFEVRHGDRDERKTYLSGDAATVEVPTRYTITVVKKAVRADGTERVIFRERLSVEVPGLAYVTAYESDLAALRGQLAARDTPAWDLGNRHDSSGMYRQRSRWLRWLPQRQSLPSFSLDELLAEAGTRSDFDPANPHRAVADVLAQGLGDPGWRVPPVIQLSATASDGSTPDPLTLGLALAEQRGGDIVLEVREPDGTTRRYRAAPGRRLIPDRPDGGFATARAALDPTLVDQANRAGLDLRELFGRSVADQRQFPEVVRAELNPPPGAGGTATTATVLAGAPGGQGASDRPATVAAIRTVLSGKADQFDQLTVLPDGTVLAVPRGADYALHYVPGPAEEGLRGYRRETGETTPDGRPIIRVNVVDSIPRGEELAPGLTQRDIWIRRVVVHETAEAAALERLRSGDGTGEGTDVGNDVDTGLNRPDALAPNADPRLTERSAHDEAHRAEVIDLAQWAAQLQQAGQHAAAAEVERQLGLLLDELGVGTPNPHTRSADHAPGRLALLDLPPAVAELVAPLLGQDAGWRIADLPGAVRARSSGDPTALKQLATMYAKADRNVVRLTRALDGIERGASARGMTLDEALVEKYERDQPQPPPAEVRDAIDAQLRAIDEVLDRVAAFERRHPGVVGTDKWRSTLDEHEKPLRDARRGAETLSVEQVLHYGNNIQGVAGEIEVAERADGVVAVQQEVSVTTPDGQTINSEMDVIADGGRLWIDAKNVRTFGTASSTFDEHREQVARQLRIAAFGADHQVDGQPPRLERHYVNGVEADVAAALEAIRIRDPATGAELPHRVTVTGERIRRDQPGPAPILRTPSQVAAETQAAAWLGRSLERLPVTSPMHEVRLTVRAVAADSLPVVEVDGQPRRAVAQTTSDGEGGYVIEVSDQPAGTVIERAVAHEVAKLAETLRRTALGKEPWAPDALRPGELADGAVLSPNDLGRLAEVATVLEQIRHGRLSEQAGRAELAALRRELGLTGSDAGATARHQLLSRRLDPGQLAMLLDAARQREAAWSAIHYVLAQWAGDGFTPLDPPSARVSVPGVGPVLRLRVMPSSPHPDGGTVYGPARTVDVPVGELLDTLIDAAASGQRPEMMVAGALADVVRDALSPTPPTAPHRTVNGLADALREALPGTVVTVAPNEQTVYVTYEPPDGVRILLAVDVDDQASSSPTARISHDRSHPAAQRVDGVVKLTVNVNDASQPVLPAAVVDEIRNVLDNGALWLVAAQEIYHSFLNRSVANDLAGDLAMREGWQVAVGGDTLMLTPPPGMPRILLVLTVTGDLNGVGVYARHGAEFHRLWPDAELVYEVSLPARLPPAGDPSERSIQLAVQRDRLHSVGSAALTRVLDLVSSGADPAAAAAHHARSGIVSSTRFSDDRDGMIVVFGDGTRGIQLVEEANPRQLTTLTPAEAAELADLLRWFDGYRETVELTRAGVWTPAADRISHLLTKLSPAPGTTYRGVTLSDDEIAQLQPGQTVVERSFTSTTRDPRQAFSGNVLFVVTGESARNVTGITRFAAEEESLYDRGTEFRVTSKTYDPEYQRWIVTMEETNPGQPPGRVTSLEVPQSQYHGHGRVQADPAAVGQAGETALGRVRDRLPDGSAMHGVRLEVRAVPAASLPVVEVDGQRLRAVAQTVSDGEGGYRIEISDQAADLVIERAVAHEVAELAEIMRRTARGDDPWAPDALLAGALAEPAVLSPNDLGRLAEIRVLARMADDPALAAYARSELAALRLHLGLDGDGPGVAARRELLEPHLDAGERAALFGSELSVTHTGGIDFPVNGVPLPAAMPDDPNTAYAALRVETGRIAAEQLAIAEELKGAGDGKYWFAKVYHYVTRYELEMIDSGRYRYPIMKMQEAVAFHATYRANLHAWQAGRIEDVESNWRAAFEAAESASRQRLPLPSLNVLNALLPSIQAHIRFDLPRAIATVYRDEYAGRGVDLEAFRDDFDAMGLVFELAAETMREEVAAQTFAADFGQHPLVQQHGFRLLFNIPQERSRVWERATDLVSLWAQGIADPAELQQLLQDYGRRRHPFSGRRDFRIGRQQIADYNWNNQPDLDQRDLT